MGYLHRLTVRMKVEMEGHPMPAEIRDLAGAQLAHGSAAIALSTLKRVETMSRDRLSYIKIFQFSCEEFIVDKCRSQTNNGETGGSGEEEGREGIRRTHLPARLAVDWIVEV